MNLVKMQRGLERDLDMIASCVAPEDRGMLKDLTGLARDHLVRPSHRNPGAKLDMFHLYIGWIIALTYVTGWCAGESE